MHLRPLNSRFIIALLGSTSVCFAFAPAALAATLHVPSEYSTIQAGIDAAQPDDTVLVAPGIYTEPETRMIYYEGGYSVATCMVFLKDAGPISIHP